MNTHDQSSRGDSPRPISNGVNVAALAKLARLEVSQEELVKLEKEIPAILEFVKTIQEVSGNVPAETPTLHNVMRDDEGAHESGVHTKELLDAAPAQKDDQIVVKQVISRKQ
ncbi:MAG: Asp-tRNA(Asn)/Glu-tRNA(Gln) amidotransferase subunit GatC [Patescibacteria group bacterium]